MALAPPCWIWDYLRRSGATGMFLPLSGGADSSCVATMISLLTRLIYNQIAINKNEFVLNELRRIVRNDKYIPESAKEIAGLILITCYMGTKNSTDLTKQCAKNLSEEIGSYHREVNIDKIVAAFYDTFVEEFQKKPNFKTQGGSDPEDIALQNIQARIRMTLSYFLAGLVPWVRGKSGFCLVLSSGNLDEGILGYLTKYDCSSGDLNPIGSISKERLKKFLLFCEKEHGYKSLKQVIEMKPTAELRPVSETYVQTDEDDMGLSYAELSIMGQLRKDYRCGPVSMFKRLLTIWDHLKSSQVYDKVKLFFRKYAINRHKMTTITPALHAESYSLDDNRYDLRQFLYNPNWTFQFKNIDKFMENNPNVMKFHN
jgi:NAD+ synthase (glutamine-hydrolysing)